jgi:hypothetical protein
MQIDEIRILPRGIEEILGIKIVNLTGKHLFIEVKPNMSAPTELILRHLD